MFRPPTGACRLADPDSKLQVETLRRNCEDFGIKLYDLGSREQGIIHVIGPELGLTQPGMTIVCGEQPHRNSRRIRCARIWNRDQRGRARASTQCLWEERPQTLKFASTENSAPVSARKDLILCIRQDSRPTAPLAT